MPLPTVVPRKSILKPSDTEVPIKNKGWKALPKLLSSTETDATTPRSCVRPSTPTTVLAKRTVQFELVMIRCYDQCVGDNPAVSYGTPVSLDWGYEEMEPIDLDLYEATRGKRRNPRQMMMNYFNRRNLLSYRFGVSEEEIVKAEKAAAKIRNQRSVTRALLPAAKIEDMVTSGIRKTKRMLKKNKTSSNLVELTASQSSNPTQRAFVEL